MESNSRSLRSLRSFWLGLGRLLRDEEFGLRAAIRRHNGALVAGLRSEFEFLNVGVDGVLDPIQSSQDLVTTLGWS